MSRGTNGSRCQRAMGHIHKQDDSFDCVAGERLMLLGVKETFLSPFS